MTAGQRDGTIGDMPFSDRRVAGRRLAAAFAVGAPLVVVAPGIPIPAPRRLSA